MAADNGAAPAAGRRVAYFDCVSGASGDMILGALIDAGWSAEGLAGVVADLGLAERIRLNFERVQRGPLSAQRVTVIAGEAEPDLPTRGLAEIREFLGASRLAPEVGATAARVFERLAVAEAAVHGTSPDEIHFHEVGALDALVDVAGCVAGLAALQVETVHASPLPLGSGSTASLHGDIPVPAPATLRLLAAAGAAIVPAPPGSAGELVTPTAAALLAELATFETPRMVLGAIGTGAGRRDTDWPNVLRLWIGDPLPAGLPVAAGGFEALPRATAGPQSGAAAPSRAILLETNIDDMNPEGYGPVVRHLFAAGALDVYMIPVYMKKGRPGTILGILSPVEKEDELADLVLRETSSFGVRATPVRRHLAARHSRHVATRYGPIAVKVKRSADGASTAYPEHDDCVRAAEAHGVPVERVYRAALVSAESIDKEREWTLD